MSFEKYEKADCTLFRLPPLDLSAADKVIEQAILRAWQQGSAPGAALHEVMADRNLLQDLVKQVAPNLQFQQQHAEEQLEREKAKKVQAYEAEKRKSVGEVTMASSEEIAKQLAVMVNAKQRAEEGRQQYSARMQKLQEMRQRLKKKLGDMGGKEGFERLQLINSMMTGQLAYISSSAYEKMPSEADAMTPAPATEEGKTFPLEQKVSAAATAPAVFAVSDLSKALELVTTDKVVDPLAQKKEIAVVEEKKQGRTYEWFHRTPAREKIYLILTYKVW